jgi:hypothetical protein
MCPDETRQTRVPLVTAGLLDKIYSSRTITPYPTATLREYVWLLGIPHIPNQTHREYSSGGGFGHLDTGYCTLGARVRDLLGAKQHTYKKYDDLGEY